MHDDPPPGVEYLGDWDSPQPPPARHAGSGRLLALCAAVVAVAVVVAIGLGATHRRVGDSVTSPTAGPTDTLSHYQVSTESPTAYQTIAAPNPSPPTLYQTVVDSPEPAYSPSPLKSDAEADPVTVRLLDREPQRAKGTVAYRVSVCVSSAALGGGKVRIQRDYWALGDDYSGPNAPVPDSAAVKPAFPENGLYGIGECATGYVTFAANLKDPIYLAYLDNRYGWYWRLS